MNREEILAKSKQENRGQDIANLEAAKDSMQFGWVAAICILCAVAVAEALRYGRMNCGIFLAVMGGSAVVFISKYLKLRKRHELILAIVYTVITAAFLAGWILQLIKG